jgi:predicted subunit of tRNA(5-methylaminomethyl-2-thiouridylate) methyltransferase
MATATTLMMVSDGDRRDESVGNLDIEYVSMLARRLDGECE